MDFVCVSCTIFLRDGVRRPVQCQVRGCSQLPWGEGGPGGRSASGWPLEISFSWRFQGRKVFQVVDNSHLVSGEVTKGPRTAAQRLPRHMRRLVSYIVRDATSISLKFQPCHGVRGSTLPERIAELCRSIFGQQQTQKKTAEPFFSATIAEPLVGEPPCYLLRVFSSEY